MELLRNRPLATVCAVFVLASITAYFLPTAGKVILGFTVAMLTVLLLVFAVKRHSSADKAVMLSVCAVSVLLALLISFLGFDFKQDKCQQYKDRLCKVKATVTERIASGSYYSTFGIKVTEIDGKATNLKAVLDCNYTAEYQAGYTLEGDLMGYDLESNYDAYYVNILRSCGYLMAFGDVSSDDSTSGFVPGLDLEQSQPGGALTVTETNPSSLLLKAKRLNTRLSLILKESIKGDPGNLASALLLSNFQLLSGSTVRDFKRTGASHILAVSGTHMTIIAGLASLVLRKLRVPRSIRTVLLMLCGPAYLLLTGFAMSAVRSVVMLNVVYLAYVFSARADTLTNVFLSGTAIILASPTSVCDIGFLLSLFATLGIVVWSIYSEDLNEKLRSVTRKRPYLLPLVQIGASLATTLAANVAVMLIMWAYFGELSLSGSIATLLLSPLSVALMALSILTLATVPLPWVNGFVGFCSGKIAELMLSVTGTLSRWRYSSISISYTFVGVIIVLTCISLTVLALIKLKRKILFLLPVALCAVSLTVGLALTNTGDGVDITFLHKTQSETVVLVTRDTSLVCDISDGSYSHLMRASRMLVEKGRTTTDVLMLTHYHKKHVTSALRYMENNLVSTLIMPYPADAREYSVMTSVLEKTQLCGVNAVLYYTDKPFEAAQDVHLTLTKDYIERSTHPTLALCIETPIETVCYIGASFHESDYYTVWGNKTLDSSTVIFGSHGPKLKSRYSYPIGTDTLQTVWFATDNVATYANVEDAQFRAGLEKAHLVAGGDMLNIYMNIKN